MRKSILIALFLSVSIALFSQTEPKVSIQWLDIETALEKQKTQVKPIFVDMYTDWCGWCKKLDAETFSNPNIATYINTYFYPVKFNAETKDTIVFQGKTYINQSKGRRSTHDLALKLLENRPSYPSMVYIDEKGHSVRTSGYLSATDIQPILIYFAERIQKTTNYPEFLRAFKTVYNSQDTTNRYDISGKVNWLSLDEALRKQLSEPKKLMILFWSKYYQNISSGLMKDVCLNNPHIAEYLNENYYCVRFEASSTDTIKMFNQTFINEQKNQGYPHQFAITLLNKNLVFPSIVFLNEKNEVLSPMQGFFAPHILEPYLQFVSEDKYLNENWQNYYQNFKGKIKRP